MKTQINVLLLRHRVEVGHHLSQQSDEVSLFHLQLHLMALELSEIQDLIHHAKHTLRVDTHERQVRTVFLRQRTATEHLVHRSGNERERRAKFMGYVSKETQLNVSQLLLRVNTVAQAVDVEQDITNQAHEQKKQDGIKHPCPNRLGELRLDDETQASHIVHPHAVAVGGTYFQRVFPYGQIHVAGRMCIAHIIPMLLQPPESVSILNGGRTDKVQRRKAERDVALMAGKNERFHTVHVNRQRTALHAHFGEQHRRNIRTARQLGKVQFQHALVRSEKERVAYGQWYSFGKPQPCSETVAGIVHTLSGQRVKTRQSVFRCYPIMSFPVIDHGVHQVRDETVLHRIMSETSMWLKQRVWRNDIQPTAETQTINLIFICTGHEYIHNIIATERHRIARYVPVVTEHGFFRTGKRCATSQQSVCGTHQQDVARSLRQTTDAGSYIRRKAFQVISFVNKTHTPVGTTLRQIQPSAIRSDPDVSPCVFVKCEDLIGTETVRLGIVSFILPDRKTSAIIQRVQTEKSVFPRSQPNVAVTCLQHDIHHAPERAFLRHKLAPGRKIKRPPASRQTDTHHPAFRADPQTSGSVSQKGPYIEVCLHCMERKKRRVERQLLQP